MNPLVHISVALYFEVTGAEMYVWNPRHRLWRISLRCQGKESSLYPKTNMIGRQRMNGKRRYLIEKESRK